MSTKNKAQCKWMNMVHAKRCIKLLLKAEDKDMSELKYTLGDIPNALKNNYRS